MKKMTLSLCAIFIGLGSSLFSQQTDFSQEEQRFYLSKLKPRDYLKAQSLNLDLENYFIYKKMQDDYQGGKLLMGLGWGLGIPLLVGGATLIAIEHNKRGPYIRDGLILGTGLAFTIIGIVGTARYAKSKKATAYTKDGKPIKVSFAPAIGKKYGGIQISLVF